MEKNNKFYKFIYAAWDYIKLAKLELIIFSAVLLLDLLSKTLVNGVLGLYDSVTLIPKFLHIYNIHNYAAAFGSAFGLDKILSETGVMVFFIVISFIAIGFFGYFMFHSRGKHKMGRVAFALIIAGALGNLIDRLAFGYVRDFIQFEYLGLTIFGAKTFAIFNFADASLIIGVVLFAVFYIFIYKEPEKENQAVAELDKEEIDELSDDSDEDMTKGKDDKNSNLNNNPLVNDKASDAEDLPEEVLNEQKNKND